MSVKKGDPLLSIYSPDLIATQQEYLLALRAQRSSARARCPPCPGRRRSARGRQRAAALWDISAEDIAELERTGTVRRALDLHAEVSGSSSQKNVVQGMR